MMSRSQLLLVWAMLSLVCGALYVASNPQAVYDAHTWTCAGLYVGFSTVVFVLVEFSGSAVSHAMVPPLDSELRALPRSATIQLTPCRIIAGPTGVPILAGDDELQN